MKLRTFIMTASAVVATLFFGGTYIVLDRLFLRAIAEDAAINSRATARLSFNAMYELMSTGWSRAQLESFLTAMERATQETPTRIQVYRGAPVADLYGNIAQPPFDAALREAFASGNEQRLGQGDLLRHIFPLRAEEKCLRCHTNAHSGDVLGAIEVTNDIGARLTASRNEFLFWSALVLPVAVLIALAMVWRVHRQLERPLARLAASVRKVNAVADLRHVEIGHQKVGIAEFDDTFDAFDILLERLRTIAVDKDILKFEIGLLEKFVITSEVVRDWRDYVGKLLQDINQIITAHLLFSVFRVDDELFDLEVFWFLPPTDESRQRVERYIDEAMKDSPFIGDVSEIKIHHHHHQAAVAEGTESVHLDDDALRLQVKSFFVDTPKIGGIVGIGVHTDVLADPIQRLVMDSILSTLMNVVGSVKAIYKFTRDLEYYATRDPLTELFNQRVFWELITYERLRAQRHDYPFALLLLDLDNFKLVNDGYGHAVGDKFLQEFARTVQGALRLGDIFARYGGDEFAIVLPECDLRSAQQIAERILEATEAMELQTPDGGSIHGAVSIGIGVYPDHADESRDLFLFADNMMYRAKAEGKQRIGVPTAEDVVEVFKGITQRSVLILKALEERRVVPFFQPIVDVRNSEVAAYEVLSRIELDGRIVGAGEFVEIAEKIGVIHKLDTLVMERALEETERMGHRGKIFLNLSPRALVLAEFGRAMLSIVDNSGIEPERIVFEITERDTIKNLSMLERFFNDLKFDGFGLAIDDFGSGFSSFHYLRRFPIDYLKIEGDFIVNMLNNPKDRAFVGSMCSLAAELNIRTVAEFVERDDVLQEVRRMGIDLAQGYHIGRPSRDLLPPGLWVPPPH